MSRFPLLYALDDRALWSETGRSAPEHSLVTVIGAVIGVRFDSGKCLHEQTALNLVGNRSAKDLAGLRRSRRDRRGRCDSTYGHAAERRSSVHDETSRGSLCVLSGHCVRMRWFEEFADCTDPRGGTSTSAATSAATTGTSTSAGTSAATTGTSAANPAASPDLHWNV